MDWNNARSEARISMWRNFRSELKNIETNEKIQKIAKYWANAPIGKRTLDFYDPSSWPTAWEILYYGSFCRNSISLLIYYTLSLVLEDDHELSIILVDDETDRYILPMIDGKYILNYYLGEVMLLSDIDVTIIDVFDKEIKKIT